jgi:hypothetical protein
MSCQIFRALVNLDPGNDSRLNQDFDEGDAIARLLTDRLVVEDRAANALAEPGSGHDQLSISPPSLNGLRNPQLSKTLVTRWVALVHREQALVARDKGLRCLFKLLHIHSSALHCSNHLGVIASPVLIVLTRSPQPVQLCKRPEPRFAHSER